LRDIELIPQRLLDENRGGLKIISHRTFFFVRDVLTKLEKLIHEKISKKGQYALKFMPEFMKTMLECKELVDSFKTVIGVDVTQDCLGKTCKMFVRGICGKFMHAWLKRENGKYNESALRQTLKVYEHKKLSLNCNVRK